MVKNGKREEEEIRYVKCAECKFYEGKCTYPSAIYFDDCLFSEEGDVVGCKKGRNAEEEIV